MTSHNISERGQALVIIAFALIGLVAMTGLAVDGGNVYSDRRNAQNAADAAVLATSLSLVRGATWEVAGDIGQARASSNGYDNNGTTNTVEFHNPPISGEYAGNTEYIQAIIISNVDTFFAPVVGIDQLTNQVIAVARVKPVTTGPSFEGKAVVGLSPHDCQAVKYQGNANTTITGGGLFVNSNCADSAFFNSSSAAKLTAPNLCAVGGITYNPDALDIPLIEEGCEPIGYPPEDLVMPNITCDDPATQSGAILSPGYISGTFPPDDVTVLASGVYCVDGNFRLNAGDTLVGVDVTIFIETGDIRFSGGANITLDAPETGPYAGLLIVMPLSNLNEVVINGNSGSSWEGTILVPGANVTINGSGGSTGSLSSQILGYTVDLSGNSDINIDYNVSKSWSGGIPPKLEFVE